jgi:hypothetical protein
MLDHESVTSVNPLATRDKQLTNRGWDHPVAGDGTIQRVAPWVLITSDPISPDVEIQ